MTLFVKSAASAIKATAMTACIQNSSASTADNPPTCGKGRPMDGYPAQAL